ncbi:hypothetical protein BO78DRAFT_422488 [Aspergillus sclerotiicarbonarius CBS 121057]|uniref:Uncharacterized protein n=1 Tax=Aspergillus sclerotiicarbonarius (strain CBS 121057 / IBT 28362) TaxID=1448318 RepID=A0A319DXN0_ASPSB|nr:hypothetical protein BO78DRAFT_422488 [Aspergillus sclerotiicarbonarius CBS 121057]
MQLSGVFVTAFALFASHIYAQSTPHGIDTGNELCIGQCLPEPSHLPCNRPKWQAQLGCYMCCLENDDAGDFADHMPEDIFDGDILGDGDLIDDSEV